ncbi:MAG: glycosyltransferase family 9 protein [Deltaproteobacteria bacterium]|nr:glycosyltransferase family 9 protein [Deltaproteobacteria bacterium]
MRLAPLDSCIYLYLKALKALDKRQTDLRYLKPDEVKNILVVSSTAIGDTLLSTPAIRAVRRGYPKAKIVALFNKGNMELFENNPNIDGIIPYHGGWKRFRATIDELKRHSFDLALIFHGNEPQATPLCYLGGARFIIKLPNNSRFSFLLSNREPVVSWDSLGHGIEARLKVAGLAGCAPQGERMELFIDKEGESKVEELLGGWGLKEGVLIGLQPGASTLSRQWFPERFIELGKRLVDNGHKVILTGSPEEAALCGKIAEGIGGGAFVAAERLNLKAVPALIKRLSAFVTGDTGPMHIAITVGTPVVALYAVADARKTGPLYDRQRHRVIQKDRTCEPCSLKKCRYQKCMENISADEVFNAVMDVLGKRAGRV